jgi:16S rRNA (cytosine1402-N4)-methyltransferase
VHVSVLAEAVVEAIATGTAIQRGVVDATVGAGGHAERILEAIAPGRLLGIDRDDDALALSRERLARFGDRVRLVKGSFGDLEEIVRAEGFEGAGGVLWDLGVSSMQFDRAERGFSYRHDAPLDMRMDPSGPLTAADVVNTYAERELSTIIWTYGEERWASRIAKFIISARQRAPINTTFELVDVIRAAVPSAARRSGPHPARRTFQALRIEVNKELEELEASLPQAVGVTSEGGRLVALSYHSLEDRIVKRFFVASSSGETPRLRLVHRKPLRPTEEEIASNPRASSARMRAAERLAAPLGPPTGPSGSAA